MDTSVVIKGYKNGIILQLNDELPFSELKKRIRAKFRESAKFLGDARMALTFDGRVLSMEEQREVLRIISENTDLEVLLVFDNNQRNDELLKLSMDRVISCMANTTGQIYRGVLAAGRKLTSESSLVICGNVEAGAQVVCGGSIVVLGALNGSAHAGTNSAKEAFVFASVMNPQTLTIGDITFDSAQIDKKEQKRQKKYEKKAHLENTARIAFLESDALRIVPVTDTTFAGSEELARELS